MKKIFLMTLVLCLMICSVASCGRANKNDIEGTGSEDLTDGGSDATDNKADDSTEETTEETTQVIVYDNWPSKEIKDVIKVDIPHYTGVFSSIEAVDASYGKMLPFIDLTILDVKADELNAYEASLVNEGYVLSGSSRYCKKVSDAHIILEFISSADPKNAYISIGRIEDVGKISAWPSSQMAEKFEYVPELPTVNADSFDIETESYAVSGMDVSSAVIACYGVDAGAADAYTNALVAASFEKSGSGSEAVYQIKKDGYVVTVGVIGIPLVGDKGAMVITVASFVDAESDQHSFPINFKCVYADSGISYVATKVGNDYMLVSVSGDTVTASFYKHNTQQNRWDEYTAGSSFAWTSTGEKVSRSVAESKVFRFMVDSNTAIYTDTNETKSICGVDAKIFTWEFEEDELIYTLYKAKHPTSGLILEVGLFDLPVNGGLQDVATSTVTEYKTNVTEFDYPTP